MGGDKGGEGGGGGYQSSLFWLKGRLSSPIYFYGFHQFRDFMPYEKKRGGGYFSACRWKDSFSSPTCKVGFPSSLKGGRCSGGG